MADFDEELASAFIGKHVLVGLTYVDDAGQVLELEEFHGRIARITPKEGVVLSLEDGEDEYTLPPDLGSYRAAPPGEYRLKSTGEVVSNPDLVCAWTVRRSQQQ